MNALVPKELAAKLSALPRRPCALGEAGHEPHKPVFAEIVGELLELALKLGFARHDLGLLAIELLGIGAGGERLLCLRLEERAQPPGAEHDAELLRVAGHRRAVGAQFLEALNRYFQTPESL